MSATNPLVKWTHGASTWLSLPNKLIDRILAKFKEETQHFWSFVSTKVQRMRRNGKSKYYKGRLKRWEKFRFLLMYQFQSHYKVRAMTPFQQPFSLHPSLPYTQQRLSKKRSLKKISRFFLLVCLKRHASKQNNILSRFSLISKKKKKKNIPVFGDVREEYPSDATTHQQAPLQAHPRGAPP